MADISYSNGHTQSPSTTTLGGDTATLASPIASARSSGFSSSPTKDQLLPTAEGYSVIPPDHLSRTLVLCFDGTGDQFDADNSNIVQFFTLLKKDDREKQLVYYQAGIGTYTIPQVATPIMNKISKTLDMMIAWNLNAHGGYEFLMQNYTSGDRICIFGFSRGAYTARALAGMLHKVGLLPVCNHQQVPFAYKMFTREDEIGWKQSNAFKKAFSIDVGIEFIGVWDTVSSVGLIPRRLPFTTSNTIVRTFRHALSLDERRVKFKANLWNRPNSKEATLGIHSTHKKAASGPDGTASAKSPNAHSKKAHNSLRAFETRYSEIREKPTDIDEVWFAGCHCDVGGGSVDNGTPHNLARIPLRWMIRECFKANTGIMFHADGLREIGLDPAALYPLVRPRPPARSGAEAHLQRIPTAPAADDAALANFADPEGAPAPRSEEEEDLLDAVTPVYDQLDLAWYWWTLEILPVRQRYQRSDNSWENIYRPNLAAARVIPQQAKKGLRVHRSVKTRMEAQFEDGSKYTPRAVFKVEPTWVD